MVLEKKIKGGAWKVTDKSVKKIHAVLLCGQTNNPEYLAHVTKKSANLDLRS